jgi:2-polyprenyl-3-methyl-5-hydroxy-6-metoxy-1,4-benzoquinol methylase
MMQNVSKNIRCVICDSNNFTQKATSVRDSKKHKIFKCKKCSHLQLFPIPTKEELQKYNDEFLQGKNIKYFGTISEYRKKSFNDTERRVNFLEKYVTKKSRILEIGSGHGFFLEAMKKKGYDISGIEISKEKKQILKKVTNAKIQDVNIGDEIPNIEKVDVIVMFHVLEHIDEPIKFLRNLKKLLKKNGILIIEVPNSNDSLLQYNIAYEKWIWQLAHISYFNPETLKQSLKIAKYKKIKIQGIQRYSLENMFNWRLNMKPQLDKPIYNMDNNYQWLENIYKSYLEKNLQSDTIISIVST